MPQPYNYLQNKNPAGGFAQSLLSGYSLGQQIKQQNTQNAMLEQKQQAFGQQQIAKEQAIAQKQAFQTDLKALTGSNDSDQWNELHNKYPDFSKQIDETIARFKIQSKDVAKGLFLKGRIALANNSPEAASNLFKKHSEALKERDPETSEVFKGFSESIVKWSPEKRTQMMDILGGRFIGEDYFKVLKAQADVGKVDAETAEKTQTTELARKQALQLPEYERKNYDKYNKDQAVANSELNNIYAIMSNISGIDVSEFKTGTLGKAQSKFEVMISGEEWTKNPEKMALLKTQLAGITMSEAIKAKAAGALSEGEMFELQKAVPKEGSSAAVYKKWLGARIKLIKSVSAREEIKKQFLLQNGSQYPSNKKFTIEIGGNKVIVNKKEDANAVVSKLGTNVYKYAPEFGGSVALEEEAENPPEDKDKIIEDRPVFPPRPSVSVTAPNGKTYSFPTQAEADNFRAKL